MTIDSFRKNGGIPLAVLAVLAIWLWPHPANLPWPAQRALALFAGIFILYLTEAIPLVATSLLIPPLAVVLGVSKIGNALTGFASSAVYLMLGAFILAAAMIETKLAERMTYWVLSKIGSSTYKISFGIVVANIILAFLIPSSTARTAIMLPICISIINVLSNNAKGVKKFAANLLLTLAFTNATIAAGILTATVPNPVAIDFIVKAGGQPISYSGWLIIGFIPALVMTLITWITIQIVFKPEFNDLPEGIDYMKSRLHEMGQMSRNEKYSLFIFLIVVIMWAGGSVIKIDSTSVCLLAAVLLYLPKVGVLSWKTTNPHIGWNVLMITGGGLSLGDILMKTGATKWLASTVFSIFGLHSLGIVALFLVVMFIVQFMHIFFAGTTVMATAFLPIIIALGAEANLPPQFLAIPASMIIGGYPLLMFYCTSPNIMVYGTEYLKVSDFPRVGVIVSIIACLVYTLMASTYWQWLGYYHF